MPAASTERAGVTLRELRAADAAAVREIAVPEIERSRYSAGLRSALDTALGGVSAESRGLVAVEADQLVGVVVFGEVAGSIGAGRLQLVVVARDSRGRGIAVALIDRALGELAADGMRVAFVELPDDPELSATKHLLLHRQFDIDARVADYFREGVDLVIVRRDLS